MKHCLATPADGSRKHFSDKTASLVFMNNLHNYKILSIINNALLRFSNFCCQRSIFYFITHQSVQYESIIISCLMHFTLFDKQRLWTTVWDCVCQKAFIGEKDILGEYCKALANCFKKIYHRCIGVIEEFPTNNWMSLKVSLMNLRITTAICRYIVSGWLCLLLWQGDSSAVGGCCGVKGRWA